MKYIEYIYFLKVNTKYISSSAMKHQYFSRMRSKSENADIFTSRDEIYLVYTIFTPKRHFSFYFIPYGNLHNLTFSLVISPPISNLIFSVYLLGSTLGANEVRKWLRITF